MKRFTCLKLSTYCITWTLFICYSLTNTEAVEQAIYSGIKKFYGDPNKNIGNVINNLKNTDNPEEYGGYFEGDLLIPLGSKRSALINQSYRWTNAVIPYKINGNFSLSELFTIYKVISEYNRKTCIRFIPHNKQTDFISIENSQTGCWSSIGKNGGKQIINLHNPVCFKKIGTVQHEIMHALGFDHEQNRRDRDNFVQINWSNVMKNKKYNFKKVKKGTTTDFGYKYAYDSIMHYSKYAFAIDRNKTTIDPKLKDDPTAKFMGQRNGFAKSDIERILKLYECKRT